MAKLISMEDNYTQDKTFKGNDFSETPLVKGEYEACQFTQCNFANSNLSGSQFIECVFTDCHLSLINLNQTVFRNVQFINCKMLGLRFEQCNEFGRSFSFTGCQLAHSSFYQTNIKKTIFANCDLQECDFTESNITGVVFTNCNLQQAVFDNTVMEKADLRTAYNYSIDPETNRMKKAKFSAHGIAGLLGKYDIEIER